MTIRAITTTTEDLSDIYEDEWHRIDLRDTLARKHAATIYRGARKVGGEPLAWETLSKHDQLSVYALMDPLLPIIAAHEAEVVGSVLDRIDALHQPVHLVFAWNTGLRRLEPCPTCGGKAGVHECGCWADEDVQYHCDGCTSPDGRHCEPFPCPTRRLTAEIRGEMSHD